MRSTCRHSISDCPGCGCEHTYRLKLEGYCTLLVRFLNFLLGLSFPATVMFLLAFFRREGSLLPLFAALGLFAFGVSLFFWLTYAQPARKMVRASLACPRTGKIFPVKIPLVVGLFKRDHEFRVVSAVSQEQHDPWEHTQTYVVKNCPLCRGTHEYTLELRLFSVAYLTWRQLILGALAALVVVFAGHPLQVEDPNAAEQLSTLRYWLPILVLGSITVSLIVYWIIKDRVQEAYKYIIREVTVILPCPATSGLFQSKIVIRSRRSGYYNSLELGEIDLNARA